jgi:hypothetical protein
VRRRLREYDKAKEENRQDVVQAFSFAAGMAVCGLWRVHGGLDLSADEGRDLGRLLHGFFVNIGYRAKREAPKYQYLGGHVRDQRRR